MLGLLGQRLESARHRRGLEPDAGGPGSPTLAGGLLRLRARGLGVRTLVDVGAATGSWACAYVEAVGRPEHLLLVEAQPVHDAALERFRARFPGSHVVRAAAGPEVGETWFEASEPLGGLARAEPGADGVWIRVPMTTIDREVASRGVPGPYLVKLDTHGFEVPILAGASATLASTVALIIECYNFEVADTALRFPAFCQHMEGLGFRCVDAWDLLYRPRDHALWQLDLLFVRADRAEFAGPHASRYATSPVAGAPEGAPVGPDAGRSQAQVGRGTRKGAEVSA